MLTAGISKEQLFYEFQHLRLLDGAGAIQVECHEDLAEGFLGKLVVSANISNIVFNELLGFLEVEIAVAIVIILVPQLVDAFPDGLFLIWVHFDLYFGCSRLYSTVLRLALF